MSNGNIFLLFKCAIAILLIQDVVTDDENPEELFFKIFKPIAMKINGPLPWDNPNEEQLLDYLQKIPNCRNPNISANITVPALVMDDSQNAVPMQVLLVNCHNENENFYVRKDPTQNSERIFVLKESDGENPDYICMSVKIVLEDQFHSAPSSPTTSPERAQPFLEMPSMPEMPQFPEMPRFPSFLSRAPPTPRTPLTPPTSVSSTSSSSRGRRTETGGSYILNMGRPARLNGTEIINDDSKISRSELKKLQTKLYQRYGVDKWRWETGLKNYKDQLCLYLWQKLDKVGNQPTCNSSSYTTTGGMFVVHLKQISKKCYLLDTVQCTCRSGSKDKNFYVVPAADKDYLILKERQIQRGTVQLTIESVVSNVANQYKAIASNVIQIGGSNIFIDDFTQEWTG